MPDLPAHPDLPEAPDSPGTPGSPADPVALVDEAALGTFLSEVVPPYRELSVSVLAVGASNLTYLVRLDDRPYVLRRRPMGPVAPRAHDMHREFTILAGLRDSGIPVPRVHGFHGGDDVAGAPCYLMDFAAGAVIHGPSDAGQLDADQADQCCARLVETLAALHAVDWRALAVEGFTDRSAGHPGGFVGRRIDNWLRQWRSVEHRDLPQVEELGTLLLREVPTQARSTLVHGDYRLGNVVLDLAGQVRIQALLDWELSTVGDPLTDLAHLLVYWEPSRGRVTHPAQLISRLPGFADGATLVARYGALTGADLTNLRYYLAFEHWRAAVIKDAMYLRQRRYDVEAGAGAVGEAVLLHLDEARDLLGDVPAPGRTRGDSTR